MRRGCIAVGKVECDKCHRPIKYGERYLMIDEEEGVKQRLCIDCCRSLGYISHETDRGSDIITFLSKE
jgi:hypothetical protein